MMQRFCFAILLACPLFAQLDTDTVTITATRTTTLRPDLAQFSATVTTPIDADQEEVLAMLAPAGVRASDLTGVSGQRNQLSWSFTWSVPIAKIGDTAAMLVSPRISFAVAGSQVSDAVLAPSNCAAGDLLADAQSQARVMATVANASLGPVLTLSNIAVRPSASIRVGDFSVGLLVGIPASRFSFVSPSTQLTCTLTAKFRLIR